MPPSARTPEPTEPADLVRHRWRRAREQLAAFRREFWLNTEFYHGRQWITWYPEREFPVAVPAEKNRVRHTSNRIGPNVRTLMGNMLGQHLIAEITPTGADDASSMGARHAQWIINSAIVACGWEQHRRDNLFNTLMGPAAAIAIHPLKKPKDQTDTGRIVPVVAELRPLTMVEFTLEPGSRSVADSRYWIQAQGLPPEQVQEHYNLSELPPTDSASSGSGMLRNAGAISMSELTALTTVYVMYERPRDGHKGRAVHVVGDKVVGEEDWASLFPFDELNIAVFRAMPSRASWLGSTFVSEARPVQQAINYVWSQELEISKYLVPRLMLPRGSVEDDQLTDDVGVPLLYDAVLEGKPEYLHGPTAGVRAMHIINGLEAQLDDTMHVHGISRGEAPGDRNSGLALSVLAEKDESPLSTIARDQGEGWGRLCTLYMQIVAKTQTKERILTVQTAGGSIDVKWSGKLLHDQTLVTIPESAVSPFSRAARLAQVTAMNEQFPQMFQGLPTSAIIRLLDFPELKNLPEAIDVDEAKAMRENAMMAAGEPVLIAKRDDHAKHQACHNAFMQTAEYERLPLESKLDFITHQAMHDRFIEEEVVEQRRLNELEPGLAAMPQSHMPMGALAAGPPVTPATNGAMPL